MSYSSQWAEIRKKLKNQKILFSGQKTSTKNSCLSNVTWKCVIISSTCFYFRYKSIVLVFSIASLSHLFNPQFSLFAFLISFNLKHYSSFFDNFSAVILGSTCHPDHILKLFFHLMRLFMAGHYLLMLLSSSAKCRCV